TPHRSLSFTPLALSAAHCERRCDSALPLNVPRTASIGMTLPYWALWGRDAHAVDVRPRAAGLAESQVFRKALRHSVLPGCIRWDVLSQQFSTLNAQVQISLGIAVLAALARQVHFRAPWIVDTVVRKFL